MSPPVRSEDPENPMPSHPRCRFLDYCLVFSVVLLTLAVGSLCTLYVTWERPQLLSMIHEQIEKEQEGRSAQLVVDNARLDNCTLEWSDNGVTSQFVGEYFQQDKRELVIKRSGFYFISSQITLKCVEQRKCEEDGTQRKISLSILKNYHLDVPILKVNVHLTKSTEKSHPSSISASMRYLATGDRIRAELRTSHKIDDWQFDREHSVLGLFWISDVLSVDQHGQ